MFSLKFLDEINMDIMQIVLIGFPALITVAKFAILAVAVVFAVRGIIHPYGRARVAGSGVPAPAGIH